jgi:hypothetical protein
MVIDPQKLRGSGLFPGNVDINVCRHVFLRQDIRYPHLLRNLTKPFRPHPLGERNESARRGASMARTGRGLARYQPSISDA